MDTTKMAVFYKEDVAEILKCSDKVALKFIKDSGFALKVGRRYAIEFDAFFAVLRGEQNDYRMNKIIRRSFDMQFN